MMEKNKKKDDIFYMQSALHQARKALSVDEVPVGAIIVDPQGVVIARAFNKVESKKTQTAHAELSALAKAGKRRGWRLDGCFIYVTLEPCSMCMNAILLSRMEGLIFGATSPIFGFQLDKNAIFPVYQLPMTVKSQVCDKESAQMLKEFFKKKRRTTYENV